MRTIAIINQKGGCGKTTSAINLAATLARQGQRTLLVDMDPQSHCAAGLGIPEQRIEMDIGDAMLAIGHRHIEPTRLLWRAVRNLDLAPSRMRLAGLEASRGGLAELPDKDQRLSAVLHSFHGQYDIVCIDCPPAIGLLTFNALAAADMVLVPVETSFFSLQGATRQVNTVRTVARRLRVQLPVWLLATIHDQSNAVAIDLLEELHRRFKDRVIPVVIRRDSKLREAASFGQSILDYAPESSGAEDYARLASWTLDNLKHRPAGIDETQFAEPEAAPEPLEENDEFEYPENEETPAINNAAAPTATPEAPVAQAPEVKPLSRAEDVARRAQEFLRRVALGRAAGSDATAAPVPQPDSPGHIGAAVMAPPATVLRLEAPALKAAPISPSTQRLLGVRQTNQGVLFVQPLTLGREVSIAAAFNNWSATSHPLRPNPALGVFELCLPLPPGKVLYRLVIDGDWCTDPYNNACEPNPFGETNSVFVVTGSPGA